jgi:hypothetical protein
MNQIPNQAQFAVYVEAHNRFETNQRLPLQVTSQIIRRPDSSGTDRGIEAMTDRKFTEEEERVRNSHYTQEDKDRTLFCLDSSRTHCRNQIVNPNYDRPEGWAESLESAHEAGPDNRFRCMTPRYLSKVREFT